ncbi:MAG: D-lactate dehydrogenase [Nevskia sp.]|nr:D-lactate dehydrogenase [Nevskia sp.]
MQTDSQPGIRTTAPQHALGFVEQLKAIVGARYVVTDEGATRRFRTGFRFGSGRAVAVVRPGGLLEQWQLLKACVAADKIVIMQAANTGLTGGSTPDGDDYDRDVVIISTLRMNQLHVIDQGRQVICFPGTTLDLLEHALEPLGREPHSVIGSSCIGASVFGGVCNNSGGALVQRGPAFTEMALFAQLDASGALRLVNHLGIRLGASPEEILGRLDRRSYAETDIEHDAGRGHDHDYVRHVREIDADTPARFNADPKRLHEASGCAGKLILFAVRLDTFPAAGASTSFYIGTNDTGELTALRREILANFTTLPISAEYLHRDAFDVAEKYGKDTFLMIHFLGTKRLPFLLSLKSRCDACFDRFGFLPAHLSDRILQGLGSLLPNHLPKRLKDYRDEYEHHLMLKAAGAAVEETKALLQQRFPSANGNYFQCTPKEAGKAFLHRFAAAGAAVRYRALHAHDVVALDVALKRNETHWFETLPREIDQAITLKLYYGHFLCHVFHQDYIVKKGHDALELEHRMWNLLDARGAEYPAEHNVGHLYHAKPDLQAFYRDLDPCNSFNPGIGRTSKYKHWKTGPQ